MWEKAAYPELWITKGQFETGCPWNLEARKENVPKFTNGWFYQMDSVRWARHSGRQRFIIGRKKVTGFREKPVLSLYSQPCLVYLQLGSCDHGSHRQWSCLAPAGKNRISALKKEQDAHQGNVATVTSYLVCQVTTMGVLHCPLWGPCGPNDMHPGLQGSTVYNSQDTGLTKTCSSRKMKIESYTSTLEAYSALKKHGIMNPL